MKKVICMMISWILVLQISFIPVFGIEEGFSGSISVQSNGTLVSKDQSMHAWTDAERVTIEDVTAIRLSSSKLYLYCGVTDTVAYQLPDKTPIRLAITYFDDGNGFFEVAYRGYRSNHYINGENWNSTETVELTDSDTWKTHIFYIDTMPLDNGTTGWDFRVGGYSIRKNQITPNPVSISAISISSVDVLSAEIAVNANDSLYSASGTMTAWTNAERETIEELNSVVLSNQKNYLYCGVNDEVAYNLPDYFPLKITVTYFDRGNGFFEIAHHGYRSNHQINGENVNSTEVVHLTDSCTWKSHSFYLDSMALNNGISNWDFRIGTYSIRLNQVSVDSVPIHSVSVEESEVENPVEILSFSGTKTGNIFTTGEELSFSAEILNTAKKQVFVNFEAVATDENEAVVWQKQWKDIFNERENKTIRVTPEVFKYGIYSLKLKAVQYYSATPETTYTREAMQEFSLVHRVEEQNPMFGTAMLSNLGWSDRETAFALAANVGAGWVKEEMQWRIIEKEKGKYEIPEECWTTLKNAKKAGLKVMIGLVYNNPIYSGTPDIVNDATVKDLPSTQTELDAYAAWCEWMARETAGYVDAFGIWNEYNWKNFNYNNEGTSAYVALMKASYPAVKAGNPNAIVIGGETSGINATCLRNVLLLGGGKYMDVWGVHSYDWEPPFDGQDIISQTEELKQVMSLFQVDIPIWWTEFGIGTYAMNDEDVRGYMLDEQANGIVMYHVLQRIYDLADVAVQFRLCDDLSQTLASESAFGLVKDHLDPITPQAAKPSYVAVSFMNKMIGNDTTVMDKWQVSGKNAYGAWFYNNRLKQDVIVLGAMANNEGTLTLSLETDAVDVYDRNGNKIQTLYPENGVYTFTVGEDVTYVLGNWTNPENMVTGITKDGIPVTEFGVLSAGDTIQARVVTSNPWGEESPACILAFYNGAGEMISCHMEGIPKDTRNWSSSGRVIPQQTAAIKVFVWDWKILGAITPVWTMEQGGVL